MRKSIHTVKGPVEVETLGLVLPHEHLFTDLRGPGEADYARGDPAAVFEAIRTWYTVLFLLWWSAGSVKA